MVNPKTGKKQLSDYLYTGPRKHKVKVGEVDIFSEDIASLPDREELVEKASPEDQRSELDGNIKHRR